MVSSHAIESDACYKDYFGIPFNNIKKEIEIPKGKRKGPRGGVVVPFPVKLYNMLEGTKKEGLEHVVSWQPHGRCFMVHEPTEFVEDILPRYVDVLSYCVDDVIVLRGNAH